VSRYDVASVDATNRNSSRTLELELVGRDKTVLDVGCGAGHLARALVERGCTVTGLDVDHAVAEDARSSLKRLVVIDLDEVDLAQELDGETFDSIVFSDVLEHLVDPDRVLRSAVRLLAPGGSVVISVPNVTHGSLRLAVLQGRWEYVEEGFLGRTHLRFFTRDSALAMVRDAGLVVTDLWATVRDPLDCEVEIDGDALPRAVVDWVRRQPDAYVYQFVMRAEPGSGKVAEPELIPAVELPDVDDIHAARGRLEEQRHRASAVRADIVAEVIEARRRLLTLRDYAIGAEAALGTARMEVQRANAAAASARADRERVVSELKSTATWRLGTLLVSPLAWVKRLVRGAPGR